MIEKFAMRLRATGVLPVMAECLRASAGALAVFRLRPGIREMRRVVRPANGAPV